MISSNRRAAMARRPTITAVSHSVDAGEPMRSFVARHHSKRLKRFLGNVPDASREHPAKPSLLPRRREDARRNNVFGLSYGVHGVSLLHGYEIAGDKVGLVREARGN